LKNTIEKIEKGGIILKIPVEKIFYTPVPVGLEFTIKHIYTLENEKIMTPIKKFFNRYFIRIIKNSIYNPNPLQKFFVRL
jgi:hypothetical protein